MTKFSYTINKETNQVEKSVLQTYPDLEILQRGLQAGRSTATIQKSLLKAYEGQAESYFIEIEEEWFKEQDTIQSLTQELTELNNPVLKEDENGEDIPLTEDELKTISDRKKVILGYDEDGSDIVTHIDGELETATATRDKLETNNEWLKSYRGLETTVTRPAVAFEIPSEDVKQLIAYERDKKVRNAEDSIADLAKMNALLMAMASGIFATLSDNAKSKIPKEKLGLIEYAIGKWDNSSTRADRQLATDGVALIDKLFDREVQIADIVETMHK